MKIVCGDDLRSNVNDIKSYIDNFSNRLKEIEATVDYISSCWSGKDASEFIKKYREEAIPSLRKFEASFRTYYDYLSKVRPIFDSLEDSYNQKINTD